MKKRLFPALVFAALIFPSAAWCGGEHEMVLKVNDVRYLFNDPAGAATRDVVVAGTVEEVRHCAQSYKDKEKKEITGKLTCPKKGEVVHFPAHCWTTSAPAKSDAGEFPSCALLLKAKRVKVDGPLQDSGADNNRPKNVEVVE